MLNPLEVMIDLEGPCLDPLLWPFSHVNNMFLINSSFTEFILPPYFVSDIT